MTNFGVDWLKSNSQVCQLLPSGEPLAKVPSRLVVIGAALPFKSRKREKMTRVSPIAHNFYFYQLSACVFQRLHGGRRG